MSIFLCGIVVFLIWYIIDYYRWVARYPKGPTPWPLIGNLAQLHPKKIFEDIENFSKKYGSVFTVFMPFPNVIINDFHLIREAYQTRGDDFSGRPENSIVDIFAYCKNGGVLQANGESWREQRRVCMTILRDFGKGRNFMEEKVQQSVVHFLDHLKRIEDKDRVDMGWPIQVMVSNIICETLFGVHFEYDKCDELMKYVGSLRTVLVDIVKTKLIFVTLLFPWVKHVPFLGYHAFWKHVEKTKNVSDAKKMYTEQMNEFIENYVAKASEDFDPDGEPVCFVQAYQQKMMTNEHLTKDQLHACCADFFLAGQETTTTTLGWAVLHLANNTSAQDKIRSEICSVIGKSRFPSLSDKINMPYTTAAIHEIQRIANILAVNVKHKTTRDTEIHGIPIPAGTCINGDIHHVLAHDPIFTDPKEFRPERFLTNDGSSLNTEVVDHCIPFSIGRRQCVGEALAHLALFIGLTATLQHYKILPPIDNPLDMTPTFTSLHAPRTNYLRLLPVQI